MATHSRRAHAPFPNIGELAALCEIADRLPSASPCIAPLLQGGIVKLARKQKMGLEATSLLDCGIDPIPISSANDRLSAHGPIICPVFDSCVSRLWSPPAKPELAVCPRTKAISRVLLR